MYKVYHATNVSLDIQDTLSLDSVQGLGSQYACHRALMANVPLPVESVCDMMKNKLPVAEEVFAQANSTWLVSQRGTMHAICTDQPPITLELDHEVQVIYLSNGCRVHITYPDGLTYLKLQNSHLDASFPPTVVLQYNLHFHATEYETLQLWNMTNSVMVVILVAVMIAILWFVYRFKNTHHVRIITGENQSALQFFPSREEGVPPAHDEVAHRCRTSDAAEKGPMSNSSAGHQVVPHALHCVMEAASHGGDMLAHDSGRSSQVSEAGNDADTEQGFVRSYPMHLMSPQAVSPASHHLS